MVVDPTISPNARTWVNDPMPVDCFGLLQPLFNDTNGATVAIPSTFASRKTRVERGVEFAFGHYETLLQRLADSDAKDLIELRQAKADEGDAPTVSLEAVKKKFGVED